MLSPDHKMLYVSTGRVNAVAVLEAELLARNE